MADEITGAYTAIRYALETFKVAMDVTKGAKDLMPEGADKQKVDEAIALAVTSADQATALLAKELNFKVCQCKFPGTPMEFVRRHERHKYRIYQCPRCGDEDPQEPPPQPIQRPGGWT